MTHLPLLVLLGLVGKDGDLLCLAVLQDLSANSSLGTILAYLQPVVGAYCARTIMAVAGTSPSRIS